MSDLYVFMKFLTSSSSNDDDELILTEHKKRQSENKKLKKIRAKNVRNNEFCKLN